MSASQFGRLWKKGSNDSMMYCSHQKIRKMNLLFDFTVDKATATIHVTREFAADLDLVWDAFTKSEILEQWMGPKPWRVQNEGDGFPGRRCWLYAMVSPENVARYSLVEYIEIQPKSSFSTKNSFCDENGNPINTGFTSSLTTNSFKPERENHPLTCQKDGEPFRT